MFWLARSRVGRLGNGVKPVLLEAALATEAADDDVAAVPIAVDDARNQPAPTTDDDQSFDPGEINKEFIEVNVFRATRDDTFALSR